MLQLETFTADNKALHKNFSADGSCADALAEIGIGFSQINVITAEGDCEYKRSGSGNTVVIGGDKLKRKLSGTAIVGELMLSANDRAKKRILDGSEPFLYHLGVSDEKGRVFDKKQAKFKQINRFLELIRDVEDKLPKDDIRICDLCCGKSYLSFAVYHYFKNIKKMDISMKCVDLKADVIEYCASVGARLGFDGMEFICANIDDYEMAQPVDLVISLHACDIATDIVLNKGSSNGASVILSTPCCHHELNSKINCSALSFITRHSMLRQKLCDSATDALRLLKLESEGYEVQAMELIDPEDTPKNIILKAIKKDKFDPKRAEQLRAEYCAIKKFLLGEE